MWFLRVFGRVAGFCWIIVLSVWSNDRRCLDEISFYGSSRYYYNNNNNYNHNNPTTPHTLLQSKRKEHHSLKKSLWLSSCASTI
mmetsp:Transcript_43127/g.104376  ORF Transcript_43127/g.104376 Transcript_43127/m.104376 type:complete len:84 (+) Transcript_43127:2307-2558(+)